MSYVLQPQAPTPRARSADGFPIESGVACSLGHNVITALHHYAAGSASPHAALTGQAPVADAEMSVDFLCQKFEALTAHLRLEEAARESAERNATRLASEVSSARQAIAGRQDLLTTELKAHDSSIVALRATAGGLGQHADMQTQRARDTHVAGSRLELYCAQLAEECHAETARRDHLTAQLADEERQYVQEKCMQSEWARKLKQIHADVRVSQEDFGIVQQRLLTACNERDVLAGRVEFTTRSLEEMSRMSEIQRRQLLDSSRQLHECDVELQEARGTDGTARAENVRLDRRLSVVQEEDRNLQTRLEALQVEMQTFERAEQTSAIDMRSSEDMVVRLSEELRVAEGRRDDAVRVATAHQHTLKEAESSHRAVKRNAEHVDAAREDLAARHLEFLQEEEHRACSAASVRRSRHTKDLMFEDVQSELKAAWRRNEVLTEELGTSSRRRSSMLSQLQRLRPEVREADDRCQHLEDNLARNARDLEDVLVQQRHSRRESGALMESMRELQRHEMRLSGEAEAVAAISYLGRASGSRTPRGMTPPSRGGSRVVTPRGVTFHGGLSASSSQAFGEERTSLSPSKSLAGGRRNASPAAIGALKVGARPLVEPTAQHRNEDRRRHSAGRGRPGHGTRLPGAPERLRADSPDSPPTSSRAPRHGGPSWAPLQSSLAQPQPQRQPSISRLRECGR